jgi:uncharacterized protein involved in exopolysaccharide biosynthesis
VRGLARFLIRLYPANWRARYGEEFEALLEDSSAGWPATFDLLKGAIQMQFSVPAFPKLALMLSIAGLLAGLLISSLVTPIYISSAELEIAVPPQAWTGVPRPRDNRNLTEHLLELEQEVLSRTSLSAIIQDARLDLYREERSRKPLEGVIEEMRKREIRIHLGRPPGKGAGPVAFNIAFAYPDRMKAQQTVQALVVAFVEANLHTQRAQSTMGQLDQVRHLGENLEVTDPPSLPVDPVYPDRFRFMAAGFGAGLAAVVTAIFRRRPPPIPFPAQTA